MITNKETLNLLHKHKDHEETSPKVGLVQVPISCRGRNRHTQGAPQFRDSDLLPAHWEPLMSLGSGLVGDKKTITDTFKKPSIVILWRKQQTSVRKQDLNQMPQAAPSLFLPRGRTGTFYPFLELEFRLSSFLHNW